MCDKECTIVSLDLCNAVGTLPKRFLIVASLSARDTDVSDGGQTALTSESVFGFSEGLHYSITQHSVVSERFRPASIACPVKARFTFTLAQTFKQGHRGTL
jgi:hypothetical protein